eukprot:scaffold211133_cov21-Tisochrysis_lutea.AAC.1
MEVRVPPISLSAFRVLDNQVKTCVAPLGAGLFPTLANQATSTSESLRGWVTPGYERHPGACFVMQA